jgi:hypothetical protein
MHVFVELDGTKETNFHVLLIIFFSGEFFFSNGDFFDFLLCMGIFGDFLKYCTVEDQEITLRLS